MLRVRPLVALTALLGATALLAGCGGASTVGPTVGGKLDSFSQVAARTAQTDSARFSMVLEQEMPGFDKPFSFTIDGAYDTPARRMQMSMDMSAFASLLAAFGGKQLKAADFKIDAIQDGLVMYMRFPFLTQKLPPGKQWVRMDLAELAKQRGVDIQKQLESMGQTDPRKTFDYLKAVSGSIVELGHESIRGVETAHYSAVVDLAKYAQLVPPAQRKALGNWNQLLEQTGLSTIPIEVWIDGDQLVRRLTMNVAIKPPQGGPEARSSLLIDVFDYGKPVVVEVPPTDEVVDAKQLAGK